MIKLIARRGLPSALALCLAGTAGAGEISGLGAPDALPGRYIVVLNSKPSLAVEGRVSALGGKYGAKATTFYQNLFQGAALEMDRETAKRMADDPDVAWIEVDRSVDLAAQMPAPWNLDRTDQSTPVLDGRYAYPRGGAAGVNIYVIDTGVRASHVEFQGRMGSSVSFPPRPGEDDPVEQSVIDEPPHVMIGAHHATNVAGVIAGTTWGVAKNATIHSVDVFDVYGKSSSEAMLRGMEWVRGNVRYPAVVNISLGIRTRSAAIDTAVEQLTNANVVVVVAAGNSAADACRISPAGAPSAITVAASDANDNLASFSNFGPCVDIVAPGVDIFTASPVSDTASEMTYGTSLAAPHVAGAAALALARSPWSTPAQIRSTLVTLANAKGVMDLKYLVGAPDLAPGSLVTRSRECYGENLVSWSGLTEAVYYELWSSRTSTFTNPSPYAAFPELSAVLDFPEKRYLKVRGCNALGCGPFSSPAVATRYFVGCNDQ